jgi:hypothetical protein
MSYSSSITGGNYRIVDLIDQDFMIRGLTATDVTFVGPAVIAVSGSIQIKDPIFTYGEGGPESLFWEIDPRRTNITGAIGLDACTLIRCTFNGIGIAALPEEMASLIQRITVNPNI